MDGELQRVLSCYGLGTLKAARRVEVGFVDENWIVETDQGGFFLKRRHPRRRQPVRLIRAQHDLLAHLRRAMFPAPSMVPTVTGETFLILDDELYEIAQTIDGEPYDPNRPEHLEAAARMLGHYHSCVAGFAPRALRERGTLYSPADAQARLTRLGAAWQLDQDTNLAQITRQLEEQGNDLSARFAEHGELPYLVIHGDYYAGNLLFDGDRIVGLVDYDKCGWQPRVAELAEALIYFASSRPGHLKHLVYPGFLEWPPFARFIQGYAQVAVLAEEESMALPDYVGCIWLSVSLRRLLERNPRRPPAALEMLREVWALTNWASTNASQMVEIARAAMNGESL